MPAYESRKERQDFLLAQIRDLKWESLLDVGCDQAHLRNRVDNYVGIDIAGKPDILGNLEQGVLPFPDGTFDVVVCLDVLEHVQAAHAVIEEILRVSNKYVVISLPNEFLLYYRLRFLLGKTKKEWGWFPRNQHKWLGSYNQAREFVHLYAKKYGFGILWEFPVFLYRRLNTIKFLIKHRPNLFASAYWAVLEKEEGA
jgi:SAM-dependent methyltransferase